MANYIQLKNQILKLQKEAEILRKRERAQTIANIKEAVAAYELTADDLGLAGSTRDRRAQKIGKGLAGAAVASGAKRRGRPAKKTVPTSPRGRKADKLSTGADKRSVVAPKYRDSATGTTWTGRGKQPKWLAAAIKSGKKLEDFKI